MATKLINMKLTSVDLVRAGANQAASIELVKSDAASFAEVDGKRKNQEKLWSYNSALMEAVESIQRDKDIDEETRQDLLQESWEQYCNAMAEVLGFEFEQESLEPEEEEPVPVEKEPEDRYDEIEDGQDEDTIEEVQKFNPFHDALGRFASSNGFSTYSANPKSKAGAAAINRSAVAGHTSTMNVHRESKGENIGQNYQWLLTGQKPAHLIGGGSGGSSVPQKPKQQKPKQKKPAQAQPQGQAQKPAATTSSHTPVKGKDLTGSFAYDPKSKDSAVQQAAQAQGFTGRGKVVPQAEFDAAVQASGMVAFRTVNDGQDVKTGARAKASDFADAIIYGGSGEFSLNGSGGQAYGGGMYMAGTSHPKKGTSPSSNAVTNAIRDSHCYGNAGNAATISATLDPSAKIGNYNSIRAAFSKLPRSERVKYDYDVGAYAAAKGYDALRSTNAGWGCDYYMVYNRTKLIFLEDVSPY